MFVNMLLIYKMYKEAGNFWEKLSIHKIKLACDSHLRQVKELGTITSFRPPTYAF